MTAPPESSQSKQTGMRILLATQACFGAIILALLWFLYGMHGSAEDVAVRGHSAILWMVDRWSGVGGDLSHGWIIPLVSAFVIWRRRRELAAVPKEISWTGLAVIVLALLLHLVGVRVQQTRISLFSLLILLWGIPWYLCGGRIARMLLFPCSYLFFCIPLSFLNNMTVPLRMFAATVSTFLLNALGIAAIQSGTAIHSAVANGFSVDVADPCSGLRSLLAMTALAAPYAYFTQKTLVRQWILFLGAAPLALAGNIVRILTIVVAAALTGKEEALRFSHDYSGYVVFVVAVLLMIGMGSLLRINPRGMVRIWRRDDSCTAPSSSP